MNDDDSPDSRLAELLRLAEDLHESFAGKPEMEWLAALLVLVVERLMTDEDEAAMAYMRILCAMMAIENTEPEPGEKLH